jgi:hypothetical protein
MILHGRVLVDTDISGFIEEERIEKEKLRAFEDADPEAEEEKEETRGPVERFLDEISDKEGYSVKKFIEDVVYGVGPVPPPTWRDVSHAEAKFKAKKLYKEAKQVRSRARAASPSPPQKETPLLRLPPPETRPLTNASQLNHRVALMGDDDPVMRTQNTIKIKELTTYAAKLEKIAKGEVEHRYSKRMGPRRVMRGDNVTVKTMTEKVRAVADDEGLSDDEEEKKTEEDTDETWQAKVDEKNRIKADADRLKKKFQLSEDTQGKFRSVLHTRRPKDIKVQTKRMITNFAVFDRDDNGGTLPAV